jgi:hypothetical protein
LRYSRPSLYLPFKLRNGVVIRDHIIATPETLKLALKASSLNKKLPRLGRQGRVVLRIMDPQAVRTADICFHPQIGQILPKIGTPYAANFLTVEINSLFQ